MKVGSRWVGRRPGERRWNTRALGPRGLPEVGGAGGLGQGGARAASASPTRWIPSPSRPPWRFRPGACSGAAWPGLGVEGGGQEPWLWGRRGREPGAPEPGIPSLGWAAPIARR